MDKELILEILNYVENTEVLIDDEWGSCRNLSELINDKEIPEFYFKLKEFFKEED